MSEEEPMMFLSYRNTSKYFLKDYIHIVIVIFSLLKITCYFHVSNNMLFSHMKILRLRAKAHLAFHWCLYNNLISETGKIGF